MTDKRWQDWVTLFLGLWLFVSPWTMGYAAYETAAWNAHILGAAVVFISLIAAYMPEAWEEMMNIGFGVWLVLSPHVLGFAVPAAVALHTAVVGVVVSAFAVWALFVDRKFEKFWHDIHSA